MKRRPLSFAAAIAAALTLAACATQSTETSATSSNSPASSSAAETAPSSDVPPTSSGAAPGSESGTPDDATASPAGSDAAFPADSSPDTAEPSADAALVLVEVRRAPQDGFDRVVLQFNGPGTPGWTAQYADSASRQGSGDPITVDGSAILDIQVTGTAIPGVGEQTVPAGTMTPSNGKITGIYNDGTFEGITHVVLGVDGQRPFRVFALSNPTRVVIDVQST